MNNMLQCPHFISYGGIMRGCLLGYFPANCETCNCPDKRYIEITTSTASKQNVNKL